MPLRWDTYASVTHSKIELDTLCIRLALIHTDGQYHFALRGKFDGIVEQVDQYLPQAGHVAHDGGWYVRPDLHRQVELLFGSGRSQQINCALQAFTQVKGRVFQLQLASFDL